MAKQSAGIICYRFIAGIPEVLLIHPGGPLWKNKDDGAWSIPKGEYEQDEDPLTAAIREFGEETGFSVSGNFEPLPAVKQKSGKWIRAWAIHADPDLLHFKSNDFFMEWPPRSGKLLKFPEADRAEWFNLETAKKKLTPGQEQLITALHDWLKLSN